MGTRFNTSTGETVTRFCRKPARRGAGTLAALGAVIALAGGAARANTPSDPAIYLYDSNGHAVNGSSQYVYAYQDPHVYDPHGVVIGTVNTNLYIVNASNQTIGFVTSD